MNANRHIHNELAKEAEERGLWRTGDTIVVAVSGGPDSMALLHMLHSLSGEHKLGLVVAHVDHGFRGAESAAELETVKRYAEELGTACETIELELTGYIEENRLNLQAAAREKRYEFLHDIAARYGADSIALAHHADDQAETVLMALIRGTGLAGLSGMQSKRREKNMELIRPLLRMNKLDLLRYCENNEIPFCTDSSNLERYYFRNTIRLDVLPYLSQFNPQLPLSLRRLAEVAGEEEDWMARQAEEKFGQLVLAESDRCELGCAELGRLHVALQRRLIKLILNYLSQETENISYDGIERMRLAAASGAPATWRMDAGADVRCVREYGTMRWYRVSKRDSRGSGDYAYEIQQGTSQLEVEGTGWSFWLQWVADHGNCRPSSRYEACFDVSQLIFPLQVRNRRPGDRIQVLGLNGSKKVQDMFVDEKIAPSEREYFPLLFDGEGRLLWIPGVRRSSHALTGEAAQSVLIIKANNE